MAAQAAILGGYDGGALRSRPTQQTFDAAARKRKPGVIFLRGVTESGSKTRSDQDEARRTSKAAECALDGTT